MPLRPPCHLAPGIKTGRDAKQERDRVHDARRGSAASRGYDGRWRAARILFLNEHPLCKRCEGEGNIEPATVVDHIQPHRGDETLFWDQSNWQAICKRHHDREKQREEAAEPSPRGSQRP